MPPEKTRTAGRALVTAMLHGSALVLSLALAWAGPKEGEEPTGHFLASPYLPSDTVIEGLAMIEDVPQGLLSFTVSSDGVLPPELAQAVRARDTARFREAAKGLETFAASNPGHPLALAARTDATLIRVGLGMSLLEAGEPEQRGDDLIALTKDGLERWAGSCPWQTGTGACFDWERRTAPPLQPQFMFACPEGAPTPPAVYPRFPAEAQRGQQLLRRASKLWDAGPAVQDPDARRAVAAAAFAIADHQLERLLDVGPTPALSFMVEEWKRDSGFETWEEDYEVQARVARESRAQFARSYERFFRGVNEVTDAYMEILSFRDPKWSLAAASRLGHVAQLSPADLADPHSMGCVMARQSFVCVDIPDSGSEARQIFEACITASREHVHSDIYTDACWSALERLEPHDYPPQHELFGQAGAWGRALERHGLAATPTGQAE